MRSGSLLLAMMMIAGGVRAAGDRSRVRTVRDQADSIGDQLPPDAIDKLYRLALSTVHGEFDPDEAPADFIYIAEEAGEAARRTGPKRLVEMAGSDDVSKVVFAARAITAFVDAVRHGESHGSRFDGKETPSYTPRRHGSCASRVNGSQRTTRVSSRARESAA